MNRDRRYRAWHRRYKTMEYITDLYWFEENMVHNIDDSEYDLMDFTGLKDKNNKDIYEGDRNQDNGVVIWNKDDASFCWEYPDVEVQPMGEEEDWCEITGNIYENPELLK